MQTNFVNNIDDVLISTDLVVVKERSLIDKKKVYMTVKRTYDFVISGMALIVLAPIMLFICLLIKIDSKGPAILVQERIGENGKIFKMYKYRSMVVGADKLLDKYLKENEEARKEYKKYKKLQNDPRVTKIGKIIRKTSIDELPQLINVFIGNMSLVGPRPYLPREKEDMKNLYNDIVKSKPGITGIWQVSGRNDISFDQRLEMDYTYNSDKSTMYDIKILLKTFKKVLEKEGAR
mgnify:FL=1